MQRVFILNFDIEDNHIDSSMTAVEIGSKGELRFKAFAGYAAEDILELVAVEEKEKTNED